MSETFSMSDEAEYLHVTFLAPPTPATLHVMLPPVVARAHEQGYRYVLFDLRSVSVPISIVNFYDMAKVFANEWDRRLMVALLGHPEQQTSDHFFQTAAQNRGIIIHGFTNPNAALSWLHEQRRSSQ